VGRPLGEVSRALLSAAQHGPAPVRELAARAQVGFDTARFKAKDLVRIGALQALTDKRPRVLGLPQQRAEDAFVLLERSFWERPAEIEAAAD
jgi:hypothetical protein